jgi:hypothetical protein
LRRRPHTGKENLPVKEYEVYVPRNFNDGSAVPRRTIKQVKRTLSGEFTGVTEIHLRKKGWWRMGQLLFRDRITIFRVLGKNVRKDRRFLRQLKNILKDLLKQEEILIVERDVNVL